MDYICHHGILGQKWGVRNGPPYPLSGGAYTASEKKQIYKKRALKNSIYNKKHFDMTLDKGTNLNTLSYDKNRTKNADMYYATYTRADKDKYNALFNTPIKDVNGRKVLKYKITNKTTKDVRVASEDSGQEAFLELYSSSRDFSNYVKDRMEKKFVQDKYKFRGYRESKNVLDKLKSDPAYIPSQKEVEALYRMFNYVIPNEDSDTVKQRNRFFDKLKDSGYSAVLDTNDAIYGGFKANAPVIVFDATSYTLQGAERTSLLSKEFSTLRMIGRSAIPYA